VTDATPRHRLEAIYRAAIDAVQPDRAVRAGLDEASLDVHAELHLLAIGKAARTMLASAFEWCAAKGIKPAGGVCISHASEAGRLPAGFVTVRGDHPHPRDGSAAAAALLRAYVETHIADGAQVVVLLSGGTSALIGAPVGALQPDAYRECCEVLLRSGLDIHAHNALRRQLSAWGDGRLASALHAAGARATVLAISDVPGDAPASIGSAPCIATPASDGDNEAILGAARLTDPERSALRQSLGIAAAYPAGEFATIPHRIISSNRIARDAVAAAAAERGLRTVQMPELLTGDAHACGITIAQQLLSYTASASDPVLYCWGGEPVVSIPANAPAGGRMQALALAAAGALQAAGARAGGITILAAGSDGRDGTTDAAGAVIDANTWDAVCGTGGDPAALLNAYDSHSALRRAHSLIPAFASGTNVNDLVIAIVAPVLLA